MSVKKASAKEASAEEACAEGQAALESRAALAFANRIVIKIGTNTIMRRDDSPGRLCASEAARRAEGSAGGIDVEYLHRAAAQIAELARAGKQVIVVTSGAIGMGARELGITKRVTELRMRQACAAIGQIALMDEYRRAFGVFGLTPAQLLVTRDAAGFRKSPVPIASPAVALAGLGPATPPRAARRPRSRES